ncbi:unnamed protein product [Rhizopus stolonifer]
MINNPLRIGSLNARRIFKESQPQQQKEPISFIKSCLLKLDILCIQETSSFHRQAHLTEDQIHRFTSFLFPRCPSIVTKYCAIVCLRPGLVLEDSCVSFDQRCIVASVLDPNHNVLCRVTNIYIPAQASDRPTFLSSLLTQPFFAAPEMDKPWLLMGDFNMNLHSQQTTHHRNVEPFYDWIKLHFNNCFPSGLHTFSRGEHRTTIDYFFGHTTLNSRLTTAQQHYVPASWTDHNLLSVDLLPAQMDIGSGSWRFNPSTAKKYSQGSKARFRRKSAALSNNV